MGVTLAAGYSLQWFKESVAPHSSFDELLSSAAGVAAGSGGLLFTPYVVGERTPHADASIRASFIGLDASHRIPHMARAVLEGITFSLRESVDILRGTGKRIDRLISIGGGAKNPAWLQMQADIFDAEIVKLGSEQGPGMGAAMLAAVGCGWFETLEACADAFLKKSATYTPKKEAVHTYEALFQVYRRVYEQTRELNERLVPFRSGLI
jgi:xylulokinase